MIKKTISVTLLFLLTACGVVKKKTTYRTTPSVTVAATTDSLKITETDSLSTGEMALTEKPEILEKAEEVVSTALAYAGVRYKYGGTTRKGMDCSGLLYVTFLEHDIALPRVSYHMANEGEPIPLTAVHKGDLLFFTTSRRGKRINHVGLVVAVEGEEIKFIHATTSRGVIVSSLREGFWNYAFVKATRIL